MNQTDAIAKGQEGEQKLRDWLNAERLAHVSICQNTGSFAALFADDVKRPDFLLLLESIGLIAIDVKNQKQSNEGYTLTLDAELRKAVAFERLFKMALWYAYPATEKGKTVWYWISALKAIEVGRSVKRREDRVEFLDIALEHFERLVSKADLGKLYTHRLPGAKKLSKLPLGT
jgi:hypothetical protein